MSPHKVLCISGRWRRVRAPVRTYCPKWSYVLATERPSCLLALYAGNMLEVASLCPISKMTGSYYVASLSPCHYIVYTAEPVVTRTSCVLAEVENHVVTLPAGLREVSYDPTGTLFPETSRYILVLRSSLWKSYTARSYYRLKNWLTSLNPWFGLTQRALWTRMRTIIILR